MQNLAKTKNIRVSFVGGDVHVAGVGRLYTQPKIHRLRYDHRFMPQVHNACVVASDEEIYDRVHVCWV